MKAAVYTTLVAALWAADKLGLDADCSNAPTSCRLDLQLACMNNLKDVSAPDQRYTLCVPDRECGKEDGSSYVATAGDVRDHTFVLDSSTCTFDGRDGASCADGASSCDTNHGFVCGAKAKDKALVGMECMQKNTTCGQPKDGYDYVCDGLIGDSCPLGLNSTCADDTLGYQCGDWRDTDKKTVGMKCLDPKNCDQGTISFENKKYTATCKGLTGATCTNDGGCEPDQQMTCATWTNATKDFDTFYDPPTYETKCAPQGQCGHEMAIGEEKW